MTDASSSPSRSRACTSSGGVVSRAKPRWRSSRARTSATRGSSIAITSGLTAASLGAVPAAGIGPTAGRAGIWPDGWAGRDWPDGWAGRDWPDGWAGPRRPALILPGCARGVERARRAAWLPRRAPARGLGPRPCGPATPSGCRRWPRPSTTRPSCASSGERAGWLRSSTRRTAAGVSTSDEARAVLEELDRWQVPHVPRGSGLPLAAPTIVQWSSEPTKRRLLPPLVSGEERWCQLFSEPGAGSDLASLATSAVRDGDEWIVNGQKVWTTYGHESELGMLLARTDPGVAKHQGITYFAVDMRASGRGGPAARPDDGRARVQRGVPHRRARSPICSASARSATAGARRRRPCRPSASRCRASAASGVPATRSSAARPIDDVLALARAGRGRGAGHG